MGNNQEVTCVKCLRGLPVKEFRKHNGAVIPYCKDCRKKLKLDSGKYRKCYYCKKLKLLDDFYNDYSRKLEKEYICKKCRCKLYHLRVLKKI